MRCLVHEPICGKRKRVPMTYCTCTRNVEKLITRTRLRIRRSVLQRKRSLQRKSSERRCTIALVLTGLSPLKAIQLIRNLTSERATVGIVRLIRDKLLRFPLLVAALNAGYIHPASVIPEIKRR